MSALKKVLALVVVALAIPLFAEAYEEREYIQALDIMVIEREEGDVAILQIGRYSPFRRYSWFRVGDVIETVDGVKTSIFVLNSLQKDQDPHIKYKRGDDVSAEERQISLEVSVYGLPPYITHE